MTEQEAMFCLKAESERYQEICNECTLYGEVGCDHCFDDAMDVAIRALEEIQQYRASSFGDIKQAILKEQYNKAIDDFVIAIICELKNKHTDMPIVDILGNREKWKEKNFKYLEFENLVYKIEKQLKAGGSIGTDNQ